MSRRESYRTSNAYNSNSYNAGISKSTKTNTVNNTGSGDNNRETYRTTTYRTTKVSAETKRKNELALKVARQKKDAEAFKNYEYQPPTGLGKFSPLAQGLHITGIGEKTFNVNKSYYETNVKGKAKPGGGFYSANIEEYKDYLKGRNSGNIDAMGRTINNRDEGGGQLVQKNIGGRTLLTTTPTTAEVSQSKAAQVEDSVELKKKRIKAKGRSPTIMTGVTGATGGLTLGKPSLLGM